MASGDAETRDMDNSNSESEHDSDEDLAVLELIDASSSDDDEDVKEDVRRPSDRRNRSLPESDRANASSRVDRPLSELVEENSKVKRYPNKTGTFVTGIDVLSKDAREKRSKRAERFGISKEEQKNTSSDCEVEDVAGVVLPPGSKIDGSSVRLEAIHLRGVDDMSTKDIFGYFKNYMPSSIEWVDDTSCNVVWLDQQSAARALAGMSRSQRPQQPSGSAEVQTSKSSQRPPDSDEEPMEEDDEDQILDLISNKETGETERIPKSPQSSSLPADTNTDSMQSRPDSDMSEQAMECLEMVEADMRPVEVKSKDITRIGKSHPKADELTMRFASIDDKKQKGAYKHSQYYLKYGNPNFGGYKGLVSLSKRKQFKDGKYHPASSDRRKRRYGYQEGWDEEDEGENLHPRKRKPDDGEAKERTKDLRERLKKGSTKRQSSGSDGEDGEKEERQNTEREEEVDEEAETLDAELKHAMGDFSPKRKMQMYADEVEAELKKLREESGTREPLYKIRDAREGLKQRLSVRDRLGHIRAAPTPASSLENLKIIVDTQDDISEKSSSEGEEEEEQGGKSSQGKGPLCQSDDLRSWLHNRETSRKLLENLPSLKIEVQDDT